MDSSFKGKTAFITGASRGVGKAIALKFSPYGMKLGLCARSHADLELTAAEVRQEGGEALVIAADLRSRDETRRAIDVFMKEWGVPHYLINSAGIGMRGYWLDITLEAELDILAVNALAPIILIRAVLPHMLRENQGHIININTIGGMYAAPYQGAYCASKSAFAAYCDSLTFELQQSAVKISTLYSGPINTDFLNKPNYESFRASADIVTPQHMADTVFGAIKRPREHIFIGPAWKLAAVKIASLWPSFFRTIIEKKNQPPARG